jgi:F0F1-type ATP synthase membrane subunit b/b'
VKRTIAAPLFAVLLAATFLPAPAIAAEESPGGGSWLKLLLFAINFAIFVYVVARFGGPMVRKLFSDRSTEIRGTLSRASAAFQEAQDLANRTAARLAGLEAEKAKLRSDLDQETAHQVRTIGDAARTAAGRIRSDAELTAAAIADSAVRRVRTQLAISATRIARELISRDFRDADQKRLLAGFLDKLRQEARP